MRIALESPLTPDGRALLAGSQAALLAVLPPEDIFTLEAEALDRPDVAFYVARRDGQPSGCVARLDCDGYAEVKRLFVAEGARGLGAGRALMARLEEDARAAGHGLARLETAEALGPAVRLYEALGYARRGPFGGYAAHPASLFMERRL